MKNTVIFDLDGTLAQIDHRKHLIDEQESFIQWHNGLPIEERKRLNMKNHFPTENMGYFKSVTGWKPSWDTFYEACDQDLPNEPVIMMLGLLALNGYRILILSGRSESVREKTEAWLHKHRVNYDKLYMRKVGSRLPDGELKKIWLEEIGQEKVYCAFETRNKLVDFWRSRGITCFQIGEGDF